MKRLIYIISLMTTIISATLPLHAVTDKEMEQARVIATQTYLRYANDGSGYLDALHPSTMAELEKSLKPKEKENIKAFKAVPVPSGYQSWDKQKLIDYWSNTAFSHAGLSAKGKVGKNPARKKLNNMKVAAPAPEATQTPASAPAASTSTTATPQAGNATPSASNPQTSAQSNATPATPATSEAALDSAQATLDETRALAEAAFEDDEATIQKESTHTWIYVVILCILVAVVVALVVFASNVMKKSAGAPAKWNGSDSDEINVLTRKLKEADRNIEELEKQNSQLRKKVEALTAEITRLKSPRQQKEGYTQPPIQGIPYPKTISTSQTLAEQPRPQQSVQPSAPRAAEQKPASVAAAEPQQSTQRNPQAQQAQQAQIRTIYLGRANAKKIFIRADRTFNPGNSVFRLDTSDGLVGTFKVVNDQSVIDKVIEFPAEMLSAACVGPDLDKTEDMETIITDSAGTAIFEGGCWKVMRKAKIHYE